MTTESAIAILIESKRQNEIMRDNPNNFFSVSNVVSGEKNARKRIDALDIAICVLREQQERENPKPMTNADRIRAMSDEELGKFLCELRSSESYGFPCSGCVAKEFCHDGHNGMIYWLQQPAEE